MLVLSVLLSAVALLLTAMYAQFRWRHRHVFAAAAKLPCPPALPLLGNGLFFIGGITSLTKNIILFTKKFKQQFCIWIGPVPVFVISDPSDVQIVLNNSNTLEKDEIYHFLRQFLGNGLLTAPVPMWKKYRRIISPVLHPGNVEKFLPIFNDVSRQLVTNLKKSGTTVDPRREIFNASTDAVMRAVMTRNPLSDHSKETLMYLLTSVGRIYTFRLFKVWLHIDWIFYFLYRREMKEAKEMTAECYAVFEMEKKDEINLRSALSGDIHNQDSERAVGKNMADLVLSYPDNDQEDHLWRDEINTMIIRDLQLQYFSPGMGEALHDRTKQRATDTVVAALAFLLVTLANDSSAQDKVYEEIREVLGDSDRDLTLRDVNSLKYLGHAIMESMRIHGTFPVILRHATKDVKLTKSVLPAGSRILVPLHAMGWDAEQFPQPKKFIPERFSTEYQEKEDQNKRHNYAFLPFSAGPRNCLGKTYALHIMKVVTVHILRKYKLTSQVRLEDIEYELKIVMFSKTPLLLDLEPRTNRT